MITRLAEHNDKLYDALFKDITDTITGVTVRTLEEYFLNLQAIGTYVIGTSPSTAHPDKTYFLRLPVDENMVEINANTRTIILSEAYRKNGIAVVGDTYAETLWFKVDRYFDLQDLSLTNIYIFWELPDKTKGYSQPAFRDIHSEGGKLIFSWTIPELLTQVAGNIKFYVSFQVGTATVPTYIFNTLTQTAKINATLDAKISSDGINNDNVTGSTILNRLHNTTNVGTIVVARPQFSSCTSSTDVALLTTPTASANIDIYAYSSDNAAVLSYVLYKDGNTSNIPATTVRTQTKDTVANPHKTYYSALTGNDVLDNPIDLTQAFEEGKRFTISEKGSYQCQVVATITINQDHDNNPETAAVQLQNTSAPAYTHRWVWETPTEFVVKEDAVVFENNPYGIITSNADNNKNIKITWPSDPKDSVQQKSAIYTAEVSIAPITGAATTSPVTYTSNGEPTFTFALSNPFLTAATQSSPATLVVGESTVSIKFRKSLNKVNMPTSDSDRPTVTLKIQSEAKEYPSSSVTIINPAVAASMQNMVPVGGTINVSFVTTDFVSSQTYYRCWQKQNGNTWVDVSNLTKIENLSSPNFTDSLGQSGNYRLKIVSKFGHDTKESYSSTSGPSIIVYSV